MDIKQFLEEYKYTLLDEHREKIIYQYKFLKPYIDMKKVTSVHGNHYISCLWANDNATSGPDTCECSVVNRYQISLDKLVSWYKKLQPNNPPTSIDLSSI